MTATIIDGNAIAQQIRDEVRAEVDSLRARGVEPGLAVVLVGENPSSASYVRGKTRDATEIGMRAGTMEREVATALIGAALMSVLLFPTIADMLRGRTASPAISVSSESP